MFFIHFTSVLRKQFAKNDIFRREANSYKKLAAAIVDAAPLQTRQVPPTVSEVVVFSLVIGCSDVNGQVMSVSVCMERDCGGLVVEHDCGGLVVAGWVMPRERDHSSGWHNILFSFDLASSFYV